MGAVKNAAEKVVDKVKDAGESIVSFGKDPVGHLENFAKDLPDNLKKAGEKVVDLGKWTVDPFGMIPGFRDTGSSSGSGGSGGSGTDSGLTAWGSNRDGLRNAAVTSANDYWNRITGANSNLRNNVNSLGNTYKTDLSNAGSNYDANLGRATTTYQGAVNPLTGSQGYLNKLRLAQQGAVDSANQAGAAAMGTARSNNMAKGAAAAMGAGQNINAYNQGLAAQQSQVGQDFNNAINVAGNVYGQNATAAGNKYGTEVSGANNRYSTGSNMENQLASNTINAAGQDIANRTNIFNAVYNNQDAIEKLLTTGGGVVNNVANGAKNALSNFFNPFGK